MGLDVGRVPEPGELEVDVPRQLLLHHELTVLERLVPHSAGAHERVFVGGHAGREQRLDRTARGVEIVADALKRAPVIVDDAVLLIEGEALVGGIEPLRAGAGGGAVEGRAAIVEPASHLIHAIPAEREAVVGVAALEGRVDGRVLDRQTLLQWFTMHWPQVLLSTARQWREVMSAAGFSTPQHYSFVLLDRHRDADSIAFAGIDQHHPEIGSIAVSKVADLLTRGDFGLPNFESVTMVEGTLVTGATLRAPVGEK